MAIRSAGRTSTRKPRSPSQDLDDPQLAAPVDLFEHHGGVGHDALASVGRPG